MTSSVLAKENINTKYTKFRHKNLNDDHKKLQIYTQTKSNETKASEFKHLYARSILQF